MNQVDTEVIEVLGQPKHVRGEGYEVWHVPVRADCYGHVYETHVSCKTEVEALSIKPGYVWLT